MAAIVQRLERLIVVQDVVGSNPTSRPTSFLLPSPFKVIFMKFTRIVSLLIVLAAVFGANEIVRAAAQNYVEGELLVKFKNGTASPDVLAANSLSGAIVVQEFPELGWQLVKLPDGANVEQGLAMYGNFAGVENVQPNYIYHLAAVPNDPRFPELYGMQRIGAPAAWDVTTGSSNVVVAVIDTGIRYAHEDLALNMWRNPGELAGNGVDDDGNGFVDDYYGYDFFFNDSDPLDENGHGTHVAGTIGRVGNNSRGVTGVNWNVQMMAIKIYNNTGNGSTSAMLVNAYNYIRLMKNRGVNIRVTNNSYGGCDEACGYDQATKDALDALGEAGVLNVFAAGNSGQNIESTPFYPASYNSPGILSVAASDSNDNRAGFSNFGTTSVDLAAPGVGVLSSYFSSNSSYVSLSGTSMASPHAAGAAALLAAANPSLSAASLKATLMNRVDVLSQWNGAVKSGGRLNVARAIQQPTICNFVLSSGGFETSTSGGSSSFNVTAPQNCDFSVAAQEPWITIIGGNPGSGNTTVTFSVAPNSTGQTRVGTIRVAGQNFLITQRAPVQPPAAPNRHILDFDGDGVTDFSAIQNSNGSAVWHNRTSSGNYFATTFGLFTDTFVPADYDGDGKTDVAVWREGTQSYFYVLNSQTNTFQAMPWGIAGDNPRIVQDFDADGRADFAVARAANNQLFWYIRQSSNNQFRGAQFGLAADLPIRGDFDGDQKADLAVYRLNSANPANTFFVLKSSDNALLGVNFGNSATDKIVPGDFDGDLKTDFAVWRQTNGVWYWLNSSNNEFRSVQLGQPGDLPVPGDYDGDRKTDLAVWRANSAPNEAAVFYINRSTNGFAAFGWGQNGMKVPANSLQIGN